MVKKCAVWYAMQILSVIRYVSRFFMSTTMSRVVNIAIKVKNPLYDRNCSR